MKVTTLNVLQITLFLLSMTLAFSVLGQTCNNAITQSTPDSRFIDNGDGTVSDLKTGLMWQKCVSGDNGQACSPGAGRQMQWDKALQYSATLNASGGFSSYTNWRLPNIKELESLVEVACYRPAANSNIFNGFGNRVWVWSSSPATWGSAWGILFDTGSTVKSARTTFGYVRLVRTI